MAVRLDLARIRALTVHAVIDDWSSPEAVASSLRRAARAVREAGRLLGELLDAEPWTLRVTLPPTPLEGEEAARVLGEAYRGAGLPGDVFYGLLRADAGAVEPGHVAEILGLGDNVFASIYTPVATERAAEILHRVALLGLPATRFAVTVPGPVETPYFPAGASGGPSMGISAALLYPRLLEGRNLYAAFEDLADVAAAVEDALVKVADRLGLEYRGLDMSLSPWMEESAARIIEEHSGSTICSLGAAASVAEVEELISDVCLDVECIGFNQVMLAVAEDDVLKERGREGCLTAYKLLHLSYACASGLDMAVVPSSRWSPATAKAVLEEIVVASRLKSRPLAARVIAVERGPGEEIQLGRFGETPVIALE